MQHQVQKIETNKLKPDPNQPRQVFNDTDVADMALNMKREGVINAIEVDENHTIITGEKRWRAAKKAGLRTVPVKVVTGLTPEQRFFRQVSENIHHNTMTPWDTALAIEKILKNWPKSNSRDMGINSLSRALGKSDSIIGDYVNLVKQDKRTIEAVKTGKIMFSTLREIRIAPTHLQETLINKIMAGTLGNGQKVRILAAALNRRPDKVDELLAKDYSQMTNPQTAHYVDRVAPTPISQIENATEVASRINHLLNNLSEMLENTNANEIPPLQRPLITVGINKLNRSLEQFLSVREALTEGK